MGEGRADRLLWEKRSAILASCRNFDAGSLWEAKRIAAEVHILVFDGTGRSRTRSLLGQMELIDTLWFRSTNSRGAGLKPNVAFEVPASNLLMIDSRPPQKIVPACYAVGRSEADDEDLSFSEWWNQAVWWPPGYSLSRKAIVCSARDQDGGSHVDDALSDSAYEFLTQDVHPILRMGGVPIAGAHLCCLRQIGWEVSYSLDRAFGPLAPTP